MEPNAQSARRLLDLARTIALLESFVPAPEKGLPEEIFLLVSRLTPLLNVDLLIQDERSRTLLTWRHDDTYGPGWHLPGGIVRYKERAVDRIREVARLELGTEVTFEPEPLFVRELLSPESRDRGHIVSLLYRCRLLSQPDVLPRFNPAQPKAGHWEWHSCCPDNLIPEHDAYRTFIEHPSRTTLLVDDRDHAIYERAHDISSKG